MRLKVLPLKQWMLELDEIKADPKHFIPIRPIIKRNGYYRVNGSTWFEIDCQAFYIPDDKMFQYTLNCINAWQSLNHRMVEALDGIIKEGLATKEQVKLYRSWMHYQYTRNIRRNLCKFY